MQKHCFKCHMASLLWPDILLCIPDEPLHGKEDVSHGQQLQLEQQAGPVQASKSSSSSGAFKKGAAAEDHIPAEGASQMDSGSGVREEPTLQDHQVAQVSSGGASQGTEGSGAGPRSGKRISDNDAEALEGTFRISNQF